VDAFFARNEYIMVYERKEREKKKKRKKKDGK